MTVGENIKFLRKKAAFTQQELAKLANISRSYLADIERDRYNPSVDTIKAIAKALSVPVSSIVEDSHHLNRDSKIPELTKKDEKDIAKRMEKLKEDLMGEEGLSFYGEPMSEEAVESLLEAMEYAMRQAKRINKKYIPKKYRKDEN